MDPLSSARWTQIDALFDEALDRDPDERTAWLRRRCGADAELYRAVARLLSEDAAGEAELGERVADYAAALLADAHRAAARDAGLAAGDRLGPYRVGAELGRGGQGVVYRAARADGAFEREVALKVVKRGLDTDAVVARFHRERRLLAALDHPGIARVLDAGTTPDGRPWLAMELVDGEPLADYARRERLGLGARVELVERVARAVGAAHRRLVVHRDLKPANVLVGADGAPRLLDFGVARLLADDAPELTGAAGAPLTPAYAAPEQLAGEPPTPAVDVYALGVMAHELLAGARPDAPGARPSRAVTDEAARAMGLAPERLARRLRGDLDTAVAVATHPDPARRYATAEALADDLARWRRRLPLEARPDSASYRLGRFLARHRTAALATAAGALALAALGVASGLRVAAERDAARAERDRAEATAAFVTGLFDAADPSSDLGERPDTLRARDLLLRGAARAASDLAAQPATQARVSTTIGEALVGLSLYADADSVLATAVGAGRRSGDAEATQAALVAQGRALARGDTPAAALPVLREAGALGGSPDAQATVALRLAEALRITGAYAEAAAALDPPLADSLALGPLARAQLLLERGRVRQQVGEHAAAEADYRRALALQRRELPPDHPSLTATLEMAGTSRLERGAPEEAEPFLVDVLRRREARLGPEHIQTLSARFNLAALYRDLGRHEEALRAFETLRDLDRERLGEAHPYVGQAWLEIGITHGRAGDRAAATDAYRTAEQIFLRTLEPGHVLTTEATQGLANERLQAGDAAGALPIARRVWELRRRSLGPDAWRTGVSESLLGECLWRLGQLDAAEHHLVAGLQTIEAADGPTGAAQRRLDAFYADAGRGSPGR